MFLLFHSCVFSGAKAVSFRGCTFSKHFHSKSKLRILTPWSKYMAQSPKGRLIHRAYINQYMVTVPSTFTLVTLVFSPQSAGEMIQVEEPAASQSKKIRGFG